MKHILSQVGEPTEPFAILAGSGVSSAAPTALPTGQQYVDALLQVVSTDPLCLTRLRSLARLSPKHAHRDRSFLRFETILDQISRLNDPHLDILGYYLAATPNEYHSMLATVLAHGNVVLTTNFDLAIESACAAAAVRFRRVVTDSDFRRLPDQLSLDALGGKEVGRPGLLVKLHGSLDAHESLKATLAQLGRVGYGWQRAPAHFGALVRIVSSLPLIVVGYSGSDDLDINPVLAEVKSPRPMLWLQHATDTPPSITRLTAPLQAPSPLDRFLRNSAWDIYLARGDARELLREVLVYFGMSSPPKTLCPTVGRSRPGADLQTFLTSWAETHGINDPGARTVLCAYLFRLVEKDAWAQEVLGGSEMGASLEVSGHRENLLGSLAWDCGDLASAEVHFEASLAVWEKLQRDDNSGAVLNNLGNVAARQNLLVRARQCYEASLDRRRNCFPPPGPAAPLCGLASLAAREGDREAHTRLLGKALRACELQGDLSMEATIKALATSSLQEIGESERLHDLERWRTLLDELGRPKLRVRSHLEEARSIYAEAKENRQGEVEESQSAVPESLHGRIIIYPDTAEKVKLAFERTIRALEVARRLCKEIGDLRGLYAVYVLLAASYHGLEDWPGYKDASEQRLKIAMQLGQGDFVLSTLLDINGAVHPLTFLKAFTGEGAVGPARPLEERRRRSGRIKNRQVAFHRQNAAPIQFILRSLRAAEEFFRRSGEMQSRRIGLAGVYYRLALDTMYIDRQRALDWAREAVKSFAAAGLREKEAHARARLARIHSEGREYSAARSSYIEALSIFKELKSPAVHEIAMAIEVNDSFLLCDDLEGRESNREHQPVGRNRPCPCGSGRKYKKCCLRRSSRGQ